jgi:serine/threonine protein kinase
LKTEDISDDTVIQHAIASENCLPVGTRLGDFQITGILGEGGFGIVYKAFDESLQRYVAIKEYMPGTLAGRAADGSVQVRAERHKETFDAGLKSFINEARLLAKFDHPSLVKVYRFWEQNRTAYMVMRYYDGQTLKDIVRERPDIVTEAWLKFIFKQILEALDTLYKEKVLHRDVSPDNIIVQSNGDAVLLDFGSARKIIGDMTQGLTVILKPGYAPVEQYSDDASMAQGPWTDIYALAAVMYFAIAKTPPVTSVARMIKDSLVMLQDGTYVGFSYKFLVAIDKGLALQPEERPQTMDEFRRLLGIAAFTSARNARSSSRSSSKSASEGTHRGEQTGPKTSSRSRRPEPSAMDRDLPKPVLFGVLGVVLALVVAGGWYFLKDNSAPEVAKTASAPQSDVASVPAVAESSAPGLQAASAPVVSVPAASVPTPSASMASAPTASASVASAHVASTPAASASAAGKLAAASSPAPTPMPTPTLASQAASVATPVAVASAAASTDAAKPDDAPYMLNVKLTVKPWGDVRVDGKKVGVSPPLKRFQLPEGKHQIRISNPAYPDYVKDIEVVKSTRKRPEQIDIDLSAGQK